MNQPGGSGNDSLATLLVLLVMSHLANTKLHFHSQVQPVLTFPPFVVRTSALLEVALGPQQQQRASLLIAAGERQQHVSVLNVHFSS